MNDTRSITALFAAAVITIINGCGGGTAQPPRATPTSCRNYAANYRFESVTTGLPGSSTMTASCTFVGSQLRCNLSGNGVQFSETSDYSSISDFVDEANTVGRVLATNWMQVMAIAGQTVTTTVRRSYDSQKRLLLERWSQTGSAGSYDIAYTAWDGLGRPISGNRTAWGSCTSVSITRSYDDQNRTFMETVDSNGPCFSKNVGSFDSNMNITKWVVTDGHTTTTATFTTISTAQVCKTSTSAATPIRTLLVDQAPGNGLPQTHAASGELILLKDGKPVLAARHNSVGVYSGSAPKCGTALATAFDIKMTR